jgi:trehalose 6-phosphate phosphatase
VPHGTSIADLPHALADHEELREQLAGRRPAVFLDYDGTLTPIVDRPEDAVISESMRDAVRGLAGAAPSASSAVAIVPSFRH